MEIVNCHIHTFRLIDVPEKFLPLGIVRWLANKDTKLFNWMLKNINPFSDDDILDRYLSFLKTAREDSQLTIYQQCHDNYPANTRYISLAMDMAFMGAGKVGREYFEQLEELSLLPENVLKFIHVDPRRDETILNLSSWVEKKGFKGLKLYPPLGYYPYDERLDVVYQYAERKKLPVISHGSPRGPVYFKGSRKELGKLLKINIKNRPYSKMSQKELANIFTTPENMIPVLDTYPKLNICIAHFGSTDWDKFIKGDKSDSNWVNKIINLINMFDNAWTDISYTLYNEEYWPMLKVLLLTNNKLRKRVLFGSDFYMNEIEGTERQWSVKFRAYLGEDLFTQIAKINPKVFLYEL